MDIFMSEDMHSSFVCCILSGGKYPHYTAFQPFRKEDSLWTY